MRREPSLALRVAVRATSLALALFEPRCWMLGKIRLIDLSVPLEDNAAHEPMPARISYITHEGEGLRQMRQFFGVESKDLVYSNGLGWAVEEVRAISHTGTHVDAPY